MSRPQDLHPDTGPDHHRGTFAQLANTNILLVGGVRPSQVYWQGAGTFNVGAGASFQGIALAAEQVTIITGATVNGRILGQTGVALQQANIVQPNQNEGCGGSVTVTVTECRLGGQ